MNGLNQSDLFNRSKRHTVLVTIMARIGNNNAPLFKNADGETSAGSATLCLSSEKSQEELGLSL